MIIVNNMNEARGSRKASVSDASEAVVDLRSLSLGIPNGYMYQQLSADIIDAKTKFKLTELHIDLSGSQSWDFDVRIGTSTYGGIASHDFQVDYSYDIDRDRFKTAWDTRKVAKDIEKIINTRAETLFQSTWKDTTLKIIGNIDPKTIQALIDCRASKL